MYNFLPLENIFFFILIAVLGIAAYKDVVSYRIPNTLSFLLAALYPIYVFSAATPVDWLGGLLVASIMLLFGFLLFASRLMGGGDVKLMTAVALWAGPAAIAEFIVVMGVSGAVLAIVLMTPVRKGLAAAFEKAGNTVAEQAVRQKTLPYGVAISVGGLAAVLRLLVLHGNA